MEILASCELWTQFQFSKAYVEEITNRLKVNRSTNRAAVEKWIREGLGLEVPGASCDLARRLLRSHSPLCATMNSTRAKDSLFDWPGPPVEGVSVDVLHSRTQ